MKHMALGNIELVAERSAPAAEIAAQAAKCCVCGMHVETARGGVAPTLTGDHENRVTDYTALCVGNGQLHQMSMTEQANCLDCMHDQQAVLCDGVPKRKYIVRRLTPLECCQLQGFPDWWTEGCEKYPVQPEWIHSGVLEYVDPKGAIEGSDSARYKMWGNGMALPNMLFVMRRIAEHEHGSEGRRHD